MAREWNRPITLTVSDCVFRENSAGVWDALGVPSSVSTTGFGGAAYISSGGEVVLEDCVFEDNSATSGGGGESVSRVSFNHVSCCALHKGIVSAMETELYVGLHAT